MQLNYMLKKPRFLATCAFGISFIIFGNTATNSVAFAAAIIRGTGAKPSDHTGTIAVIAIAANTFCVLLHSMSRKWGVRFNNVFGMLKLAMLLVMIIFGFVWLNEHKDVTNENFRNSFSTEKSPTRVYRYAEAAVIVLFPFGGFHQANYVSEITGRPRALE